MALEKRSLAKHLSLRMARVPWLGEAAVGAYLRRRYGARVVTAAKVRNFIQAQTERYAGAVEVESLPWILNLDTFSGCNLRCPFCPTGTNQIDREVGRMPLDQAKRILDLVRDHVLEVRLYNWGEPFLNPDIFEIIRYAREAGLFTVINSNLSVKVPELGRKVVDSGLHRLQASVDGISQSSLEIYRRRARADLVFANVKEIAEERRRRGVDHPRLALAFLVFRHNEHELDLLDSKRREIGADEFWPRRAFIFHESFIPRHRDFAPLQQIFTGTCGFLYSELTVEATGAISPCCTNMSTKWDVGAASDLKDVRAVWNGSVYRAMRGFMSGRPPEPGAPGTLCHHCDLVEHPGVPPGPLSPLPPAFKAAGEGYRHGLNDLGGRLGT